MSGDVSFADFVEETDDLEPLRDPERVRERINDALERINPEVYGSGESGDDGSGPVPEGTPIRDAGDLLALSDPEGEYPLDGSYYLADDVDLSELEGPFLPIGTGERPFTGTLLGNGYTIDGPSLPGFGGVAAASTGGTGGAVAPPGGASGLFGTVGPGGVVDGVTVTNVDVSGPGVVGGLVGRNLGTVRNSSASGTVERTAGDPSTGAGGLVGVNGGTVTGSSASVTVRASLEGAPAGGLVGVNGDPGLGDTVPGSGTVDDSTAGGEVSGGMAGGLVGINAAGTIANSSADADVRAIEAGGLVGINGPVFAAGEVPAIPTEIEDSTASGSVSGSAVAGGLVGANSGGTVRRSTAEGDVVGVADSFGDVGVGAGGLVGVNDAVPTDGGPVPGTVEQSTASGSVSGSANVGGLAGLNSAGRITASSAAGEVEATTDVPALPPLDGLPSGDDSGVAAGGGGAVVGEASPDAVGPAGGLVGTNLGGQTDGDLVPGIVEDSSASGPVTGEVDIGGLVGVNRDGIVRTSSASGDVDATSDGDAGGDVSDPGDSAVRPGGEVGGLVGANLVTESPADPVTEVRKSWALGAVSGEYEVGGLVGTNEGPIVQSFATGPVAGGSETGGLVGFNEEGGRVENAYATGDVSGENAVGGLVGYNVGTVTGTFAAGAVSDTDVAPPDPGGLVAQNASTGSVSDSYWDETVGPATSDGGTPLATAEMQGSVAKMNMDALAFPGVWQTRTSPDGYPTLATLSGVAPAPPSP